MGNQIIINCKKVYDTGIEYLNDCDKIEEIQKELIDISETIKTLWNGVDNHNFDVSFSNHIKELDNVLVFLSKDGEILKKNSLMHNDTDNTFATKIERSGLEDE